MRVLERVMPVCMRDVGVMWGACDEPSRVHARLPAGASDGGGEGDALAPRIMVWVEVMLPVILSTAVLMRVYMAFSVCSPAPVCECCRSTSVSWSRTSAGATTDRTQ